ncbi:MAG: DUF2461 domain-containing protein, partial [Kiritimatiellaeota bacterium]|nr:DUF2461 domain-containing protein [Kiritimatiellota bacterium]
MISAATLKYLRGLKAHNERPWFETHRADYAAARAEFVELVDKFIGGLAAFDRPIMEQDPGDCIFRILRDARFARDKTPYKIHWGAFVTDRGRRVDRAGYYLHVQPGESLVAAGLYRPPTPELKAVRRAIEADGDRLRRIISARTSTRYFGPQLPGPRLKTAPRDYPKDHPQIDLLRYTSFAVWHEFTDAEVLKPDFLPRAVAMCKAAHALVHFLNRALAQYPP